MRITKVDIPKSDNDGLEHIKMDRLGRVVLVTGRNGAGKTRILNKIKAKFRQKPIRAIVSDQEERKLGLEKQKRNVLIV